MTLKQIEDGKTTIIITNSNPAYEAHMQAIIRQLNPDADIIVMPVPPSEALPTDQLPDESRPEDIVRFDRLSPRQQAVLLQIVKGRSNKDIARRLDISVSTVRVHVSAMFRVLGVSSRTAAAAMAAGTMAQQYASQIPAE